MFLHDIIFSYYLTATQTITFGYIKCNPAVSFIGIYLPCNIICIVCQERDRQKNFHQKCGISLSFTVFTFQSLPCCHVCFVKNERLEWEIKVSLVYYSVFYLYHVEFNLVRKLLSLDVTVVFLIYMDKLICCNKVIATRNWSGKISIATRYIYGIKYWYCSVIDSN